MSCLNPNLIRWVVDPSTGSLEHVFLGPARYTDPEKYGSLDALLKGEIKYFYQTVPCQQCPACRLDYSREWATRLCLELKSNPKALFITLTYRNSDLRYSPLGFPILSVRDTQLFWKRLRREFPDTRIRFYLSGEYGSRTCRPHYHAIVYGLDLTDFPDIIWRSNNYLRQPLYSSPKLEQIWSHGNVRIGLVTSRSCAYTARYVNKKQFGADDRELGDRTPPFTTCSRRPGIGMLEAPAMVASGDSKFAVQGRDQVLEVTLPRAFIRYAKDHAEEFGLGLDKISKMQYTKSELGRERMLSQLKVSGLSFPEWLCSREKLLHDRLKKLPERGDL